MTSEMLKYLAIALGGLAISLGLVALSRHLRNAGGEQKIKDEVLRNVLKDIRNEAEHIEPGNLYEADELIYRLIAFVRLHNKQHTSQAKYFKPHLDKLNSALAIKGKNAYTAKMEIIRSTCKELLGRIPEEQKQN